MAALLLGQLLLELLLPLGELLVPLLEVQLEVLFLLGHFVKPLAQDLL